MVTRSVAERYAWGNCHPRMGRRTQTISRQQERSGSAFFYWHTASAMPSPEQQGCGGRHRRQGVSQPDRFHPRSPADGRPVVGELRPRNLGGAGVGMVRASSPPSVVRPFGLIHGVVGIGADPGTFYWAA